MTTSSLAVLRSVCFTAVLLAGASLQAAILLTPANESFAYTTTNNPADDTSDGDLSGNLGGSGFTSAWFTGNNGTGTNTVLNITSPGLTSSLVPGTGNALSLDAAVAGNAAFYRQFATTADPINSGSLLFSFMIRRDSDSLRTINLALFNGTSEIVTFGMFGSTTVTPSGNLSLVYNNNNVAIFGSTPLPLDQGISRLVVGRIDFATGLDRVRIYVDPTAPVTDSTVPYIDSTAFDLPGITQVRPFTGGAATINGQPVAAAKGTFDEISISPVSPVPEPTTAGLCAVGIALLCSRRRRSGQV